MARMQERKITKRSHRLERGSKFIAIRKHETYPICVELAHFPSRFRVEPWEPWSQAAAAGFYQTNPCASALSSRFRVQSSKLLKITKRTQRARYRRFQDLRFRIVSVRREVTDAALQRNEANSPETCNSETETDFYETNPINSLAGFTPVRTEVRAPGNLRNEAILSFVPWVSSWFIENYQTNPFMKNGRRPRAPPARAWRFQANGDEQR